ncbi:neuronal calcium sensor 1 isoform X1 [Ahaetulla prasina]|uniref:neuronal calcium sensor 1 isoform X1 n=1 Tax=Ahaetulla prasina TaxID=499056 RepID=UPI002647A307|nr:neuronal calcium sensor 1 isoform X1 [Ahaetulla prasina]
MRVEAEPNRQPGLAQPASHPPTRPFQGAGEGGSPPSFPPSLLPFLPSLPSSRRPPPTQAQLPGNPPLADPRRSGFCNWRPQAGSIDREGRRRNPSGGGEDKRQRKRQLPPPHPTPTSPSWSQGLLVICRCSFEDPPKDAQRRTRLGCCRLSEPLRIAEDPSHRFPHPLPLPPPHSCSSWGGDCKGDREGPLWRAKRSLSPWTLPPSRQASYMSLPAAQESRRAQLMPC